MSAGTALRSVSTRPSWFGFLINENKLQYISNRHTTLALSKCSVLCAYHLIDDKNKCYKYTWIHYFILIFTHRSQSSLGEVNNGNYNILQVYLKHHVSNVKNSVKYTSCVTSASQQYGVWAAEYDSELTSRKKTGSLLSPAKVPFFVFFPLSCCYSF